ncbi:MAG: hypothetical protein JJU13_04935 [Balneolaceae bacterium]|nr:hypothetical protein [Balneolaceae bacterium]
MAEIEKIENNLRNRVSASLSDWLLVKIYAAVMNYPDSEYVVTKQCFLVLILLSDIKQAIMLLDFNCEGLLKVPEIKILGKID